MAKKTYAPKEFVWTLDLEGEDKIFKCLVTDTECITYEGDKECKHLKIMNPVRKNNVLQIDTVTTVYGQQVPFQLENGIPYIKLDSYWKMSDTNRADRIAQGTRVNWISSFFQMGAGVALIVLSFFWNPFSGTQNKQWMLAVLGGALIISGFSVLSRLKAELDAIEEADALAEMEKEERRAEAKQKDSPEIG